MVRIKSSNLRDKILSANDEDLIEYLEKNVVNLNKYNKPE